MVPLFYISKTHLDRKNLWTDFSTICSLPIGGGSNFSIKIAVPMGFSLSLFFCLSLSLYFSLSLHKVERCPDPYFIFFQPGLDFFPVFLLPFSLQNWNVRILIHLLWRSQNFLISVHCGFEGWRHSEGLGVHCALGQRTKAVASPEDTRTVFHEQKSQEIWAHEPSRRQDPATVLGASEERVGKVCLLFS